MADGGQHLSPEAAAIEVLRRRRARAHLDSYSQSITIPGAPMSNDPDEWIFKAIETAVARHHIVTMRAIEKCIRTDYGRLMIFEPPGSAKSTYGSVVAPSWAMGAFPGVRVLMTSYAATPIIRHSKRCRQILASREYTSIWETETRLVEGSSAADEFELTNGSGLFATGLLGAMTSVRCFPAGTLVQTPFGPKPIEHVCVGDKVSSMVDGMYTVRVVTATRSMRHEGQLIEVGTSNGRAFRCTPEHRVFTAERGYTAASILSAGDTLFASEGSTLEDLPQVLPRVTASTQRCSSMCALREEIHKSNRGNTSRGRKDNVLRAKVQLRRAISSCAEVLSNLWQGFGWTRQGNALLQFDVLAGACARDNQRTKAMPAMRQGVQTKVVADDVLLTSLCEPRARSTHDRLRQFAVQGWQQLCRLVSFDAASDIGTRLSLVRGVRVSGENEAGQQKWRAEDESSDSPLRQEPTQQSADEPHHDVRALPWQTPCTQDTVSMVRRVGGQPVTVYDLTVEETQCFFANEILVHNCDVGIIDDPVAGREEAESETMRIKTLAAYEDDFLTRLKPKASIIIISTRWHQDDLPGCILPENYDGRSGPVLCRDGQVWEVLNIQAKCELADDPVGRKIGEYLWPEWFGPPHWAMYERNARTWASLYQQRPSPQEGIYFKRENFRRYDGLDPPDLRYYMASDFAVKEQKDKTKHGTPDFSEHGMFGTQDVKVDGFNEQRVFITDWWSGQVESDESIDAALDMVANRPVKKRPGLWFGELGVIEHAIGPQIRTRMRQRKVFIGRELLPSIVDKVARCAAFIGMVNAQVVYVKNGQWGDELIDQLCSFPAGRYDDKVDVCGMFGRGLDLVISGKRPRPAAKKSWRDKLRAHYGKQRSPMTS